MPAWLQVAKVPLAIRFAHVGEECRFGRQDPYPEVPLITDIPDHMQDPYVRSYDLPDPPTPWYILAGGASLRAVFALLNTLVPGHAAGKL